VNRVGVWAAYDRFRLEIRQLLRHGCLPRGLLRAREIRVGGWICPGLWYLRFHSGSLGDQAGIRSGPVARWGCITLRPCRRRCSAQHPLRNN